MIYFDYTATTAPNEEILELHKKINKEYWYNSETLYHKGIESENLYEESEQVVINTLKLQNKKVLFTSGATEANNTAIYGYLKNYIGTNKHVIVSAIEHASVLNTYKDLERLGFEVTYLVPNEDGIITPKQVKDALKENTILVSIMWVNNVIGVIEPISEIIKVIKDHNRAKLHVDCVQGFGKIVPDFNFNDIDFLVISGHKLHGLKGTGLLIYSQRLALSFMQGGMQQNGTRPGTLDLAGCVAMAKTIKNANNNILEKYNDVKKKYEYLINNLKNENHFYLNIHTPNQSPYIISITFKNLKGETAMHMLEEDGIIVGLGSACHTHARDAEEILKVTLKDLNPINTIRVSLSTDSTLEEIDKLINSLKKIGK